MTITECHSNNGVDRLLVSANSPFLDLIEHAEDTWTGLDRLEVLVSARQWLDTGVLDAVAHCRTLGKSWQDIADVLGVTKQAAQQRYGD